MTLPSTHSAVVVNDLAVPLSTAITTRRTNNNMNSRLVDIGAGAPETSASFPARLARHLVLACGLMLLLVAVLWAAGPAHALNTHAFSSSFGSSGAGDGQLSLAANSGVAVSNTTHDVYVADTGNARVDQFDATGVFVRAFGADVGGAGVNVCTSGCVAGTPGVGAGAFLAPTFVAVDNSGGASAGDVYVADTGDNVVTKFSAAGVLISAWGTGGQLDGSTAASGPFGPLAGIAVDAAGTLDVFDTNTRMFEFADNGTFATTFTTARGTAANGLGVDASGNFFKVNGSPTVEKFTADGTDIGQVTGSTATGLAVDAVSGDLYTDTGTGIEHYTFPRCAPGSFAGCDPVDVFGSANLTAGAGVALDPTSGTIYAADAGSQQIAVFGRAVLPDATTNPAAPVGQTTATLNGHLDPVTGGAVTACHFDYVDDAAFQASGFSGATTVACAEGNAFSAAADVHADISGLSVNTTYHVRLDLANAQGAASGADQPFTTQTAVLVTIAAADPVAITTATLNGHVDPGAAGGSITACHFDYTDDADFQANGFSAAQSTPCTPATPITGATDVSADITGLAPDIDYHVRLVATDSLGTTTSADQPFHSKGAAVRDEWTTDIGTDTATLHALINPNLVQTTYHFDYGTSTTYGQTAPVPDATLGTGTEDLTATQLLTGLTPATTYHYRVVTTNTAGTVNGPDHTFTTRSKASTEADACPNAAQRHDHSAGLPDCRAYEQVSPTEKGGGDAGVVLQNSEHSFSRAAGSGNGLVWATLGTNFAGGAGNQTADYLISRRTADGWSTDNITPALDFPELLLDYPYFELVFNDDLTRGVTITGPYPALTPDAKAGQENLYLSDLSDPAHPSYQMVTPAYPHGSQGDVLPSIGGASADLTHVVFAINDNLTPDAVVGGSPAPFNIYEWVAGHLRLVNVAPDGTPIAAGGGGVGGGGLPFSSSNPRLISADGSRIFWEGANGNLYVRENGMTTVQVDASQGSGPGGGGSFLTASSDGSQVIFTAPASSGLTSDTVSGSGQNLYRYDVDRGVLTDLTPTADAQFVGLSGSSDDGSYVYFVANGVLASGAQVGDCAGSGGAESGRCNLYVSHAGTTTFIGTLDNSDNEDWEALDNAGGGPAIGPVATTPDGTHFAFQSVHSITGYDNTPANPPAQGPTCGRNSDGDRYFGPCPEVFLYDAASNHLVCASCNPTGARPQGPSTLQIDHEGDFLGTWGHHPRDIADDGRLFFDSVDSLVSRDTNGTQDVYEYSDGRAELISSGTGNAESLFLDAPPSGSDVFFNTRDRLVGQDTDTLYDVYDARTNGGLAYQSPAPVTPCSGEACRGVLAASTPPPSAATVTFTGPGNTVPAASVVTPKVKVTHTTVSGSRFVLTVKVPAKGSISISGAGIRTARKSASKAGSYRVTVTLTAAGKSTLRHKHRLKLRARVGYTPAHGSASSAIAALTLKSGSAK
jgi:hypothetical protein